MDLVILWLSNKLIKITLHENFHSNLRAVAPPACPLVRLEGMWISALLLNEKGFPFEIPGTHFPPYVVPLVPHFSSTVRL